MHTIHKYKRGLIMAGRPSTGVGWCKTKRQLLGLTQAQLAQELGISVRQVIKIEHLQTSPPLQTLLAIECLLRRRGLLGEEEQVQMFPD